MNEKNMEPEIKREGLYSYVSVGQGEPLLLLHGLFGALSNFRDVLSHFSDRYEVVIPMLPVYNMPLLTTGVKTLASYVNDFIRHRGYSQVHLLGNSLGGHVALIYGSKHPQKVKSLTLTASSGLYENAFGSSFPRREDKEFIRQKVALTFYDPRHATDALVDECFEVVNDRNRVLKILAMAKSAIRHNMADELGKLTMPACLIWGRNDTITPPEVAEDFKNGLPDADLFWIDQCGHAPMMEHPEEFNSLLDAWLKSRGFQ